MPRALPLPHADLAADPELLAILRACADPVRLSILRLLAEDAFGVQELCRMLELGQPNLSHHLKLLSEAGLVHAHRDGTHTFYRRALVAAERPEAAVQHSLLAALDADALPPALERRRSAVFEARAERSRAFFARHADAFDRNRDLIAAPEHYLPVLAELLPERAGRALEIGPGPGEFLTELAQRFTEVVALDASPEMLERARRHCQEAGLTGVTLIAAELPDASEGLADAKLAPRFDAVICAMVLHHTPDPAAMLARCGSWLRPGGVLLIAELCPHTQDWVADACGDVWRGFDPEQLSRWAQAAGLTDDARQFLAQRNGFRIQLRRFLLSEN
ncbi:MAG: ArsR family transcriptional regulator [Gammaproteobacteria bacterium]|nr:ArsR family transcriptional regulator [Gammaproteobacteria bacterium]